MESTVRIVRQRYGGATPERAEAFALWSRFAELTSTVSRCLPASSALLFARPVLPASVGGPDHADHVVSWFSERSGQPRRLLELSREDEQAARALLAERLEGIRHLADRLSLAGGDHSDGDQAGAGALLRAAARAPGDDSIWVIEGEPVLVSWGSALAGTPVGEPAAERRRMALPLWAKLALIALLLAALAAGLWFWQRGAEDASVRAELAAALANECEPSVPLTVLIQRLERLDPNAERYRDVLGEAMTEREICAEAARFGERIAVERDCPTLQTMAEEFGYYNLEREPFRVIAAELDGRLRDCGRVQGLQQRLRALTGDCRAVDALRLEIKGLDPARYTVDDLRADYARATDACRLAEAFTADLDEAGSDCPALRTLARRHGPGLVEHDSSADPLRAPKARLDTELARCDLAEHLQGELAVAQNDCLQLAALEETVQRHEADRPPIAAIAEQLSIARGQCAELDELERRFAAAHGECSTIGELFGGLERYRGNLRFADIGRRLRAEQKICAQAAELEGLIAKADCAGARELKRDSEGLRGNPKFSKAFAALDARITDCDRFDRYRTRLTEAGKDCKKLNPVRRDLLREKAKSLRLLRREADQKWQPCKPKPPVVASPVVKPKATKRASKSGVFPMVGQCSGSLEVRPPQGRHGTPVKDIVNIGSPESARIARVTSTNPLCRNCNLRKVGGRTWVRNAYYHCPGRNVFSVSYTAYDAQGRAVCRGRGSALCLGR